MSLAAYLLMGINLMLAQVAADTPAHVSLWLTLLLAALSSVGATALTLVVSFWQLRKSEAYRRASRWEPIAEQLWNKRLEQYQNVAGLAARFVTTFPVVEEIKWSDHRPTYLELTNAISFMNCICSSKVGRAVQSFGIQLTDALNAQETSEDDRRKMRSSLLESYNALRTAMREDLAVEPLGSQTQNWLATLPG